jgi:hypothetical protein
MFSKIRISTETILDEALLFFEIGFGYLQKNSSNLL